LPLPVAVLLCVGTGAVCGLGNGAITVRFALPSFIVTLGMLEMARGAAYLVTGGRTQYIGSSVQVVGETSIFGLSLPFLLAFGAVVLGQLALTRTVWGRYVRAIGANEEAVRLSGVNTRRVKTSVFVLSGALAGWAALVNVSRLASADPNAGTGFELQAIAAVVIGGTSLLGGRGSVARSFLGVVLIAILGNGLAQVGAQEPVKRLVTGGVIVAAVVLDYYRRRGERAGS
jgi:ribose transport system permease protein